MSKEQRSASLLVRNPLLSLPAAQKLQTLPPEAKEALRLLLKEISDDARLRAEKSWRTHKGPMALYWKTIAVLAGHSVRMLRPK